MNINKIRKLIKEKEITQNDIASQMGLSGNAISQKLKKGDFKISDLEKMAKILEVPVCYFFEEEKNENGFKVSKPEVEYGKSDSGEVRALKETIEILKGQVEYFKMKYEESTKNK